MKNINALVIVTLTLALVAVLLNRYQFFCSNTGMMLYRCDHLTGKVVCSEEGSDWHPVK